MALQVDATYEGTINLLLTGKSVNVKGSLWIACVYHWILVLLLFLFTIESQLLLFRQSFKLKKTCKMIWGENQLMVKWLRQRIWMPLNYGKSWKLVELLEIS